MPQTPSHQASIAHDASTPLISRSRKRIAELIGVTGILTAVALIIWADVSDLRYVWANEFGMVLIAGPSAYLAGLLTAGLFGHDGRWGWVAAVFGALLSTVLGGAIAGTLLVPAIGTLIAPLFVLLEGALLIGVIFVWCTSMTVVHLYAVKFRR